MSRRPREGIEFNVEEFKRVHGVDDEYLVLGIDEAGRGPAIGPMVYCGALISLKEHDDLVTRCGVADSKVLTEEARLASLPKLESLSSFVPIVEFVTSSEISEAMTGRHGKTLNTISHATAMSIICKATDIGRGKLVAVYVDTVGVPEHYERMLAGRFPHLRVVVSKKADSKYPIVSAASIVAKTARDRFVESLGIECGSGYPSDPLAKRWLATNLHRYFGFPLSSSFVRQSWLPVVNLVKQNCVEVEFEHDWEKETGERRQPKLNFTKQPPKRDPLFGQLLGLKQATLSLT